MTDERYSRQDRKKQSQKNSGKIKKNRKGIWKKVMIALSVFMVVLLIAGAISVFAIMRDAPEIDRDQLVIGQNPTIVDVNGEEVETSLQGSEDREYVSLDEIPPMVREAFIAVEDVRFYDHFGVDLRRIGGAVLANISDGFGAEGASTITQQLVKNLYLDFDKSITRKLQEQYMAVQLERQFTKDQILEMYLNAIYFGDGKYGVATAADHFYSKNLDELTINEAALLAGIPQRPTAHNPIVNPETSENRRNTVINRMFSAGFISEEEAEQARNISVEESLNVNTSSSDNGYRYQAYIDQVVKEVENIDGIESSDIYTSGMTIHTNLNTNIQQYVEDVMNDSSNFNDDIMQGGLTILDTKSSQVYAIGGKRGGSTGMRELSFANEPKQLGSTAKPIYAYGPGIEYEQWSTWHQFDDSPHEYSDGGGSFSNFDSQFLGNITMREALYKSQNIPAVKAIQDIGTDRSQSFAEGLGIESEYVTESYALGTNDVSTYDAAAAYAAFGNGGDYTEPYTVRKVEFTDGQEIDLTPDTSQAMEDYTAYMVTDMLKDVLTRGTATDGLADVSGVPIAGKTGSQGIDSDTREQINIPSEARGIKDSWFIGYSTELTAAVWTGYDRISDPDIDWININYHYSRTIFGQVMRQAHEGLSPSDFNRPDSVVRVGVEKSTGLLPSEFTPDSEIIQELFVRGTEPTDESEEFFEVEPVSGLTAEYIEDEDLIFTEWQYPEELIDDVSFRLEVQEPGEDDFREIDTMKDLQYQLSGPEPGETYAIRVTALSDEFDDIESEPQSVQVTIPEEEPEEDEEEDEEENGENENNNGNNDNENNNENNNGNNNNGNQPNNNQGNNQNNEEENDSDEENETVETSESNNEAAEEADNN
ncbi:PBP1A family penicillin-binding protein [Salisediminibacterium beveridgei]|uniref:Multimodular transpeptidase-transglycosylase / Penicillin-binding protein 1A/1B (PBP1) n=1 Tax=Salisediminibacterium beveridgei TaxID=632773 RepID=A0A1D7QV05_9BACI|nr:PBP1A family penicillin-binding protein [Salisediminibacterium beveridgei]AOM82844.1 Multimodular transpeptidase-transglycosylase / Penicillin-binding protein 1A/1B (PBP1) [Salisediminibacterium beveridgei]